MAWWTTPKTVRRMTLELQGLVTACTHPWKGRLALACGSIKVARLAARSALGRIASAMAKHRLVAPSQWCQPTTKPGIPYPRLYPRANEPVAIPPLRTGGSFVKTLINGRNHFRITHAWTLCLFEENITNQSTPWILTNWFRYHKFNERVISLDVLSICQFYHTSVY